MGAIGGGLSPGLRKPCGLFSDEDGGLWVCDTDNVRLLRLDADDSVSAELSLRGLLPDDWVEAVLQAGCANRGWLFVVLETPRMKTRRLISFRAEDPSGTVRVHELFGKINPRRVFPLRGEVFVFDWPGEEAVRLDAETGALKPLQKGLRQELVRGMAHGDGFIHLLSGKRIVKATEDGIPVFTYDLAQVAGTPGFSPLAMTEALSGENRRLLISDGISGSVFLFGA